MHLCGANKRFRVNKYSTFHLICYVAYYTLQSGFSQGLFCKFRGKSEGKLSSFFSPATGESNLAIAPVYYIAKK